MTEDGNWIPGTGSQIPVKKNCDIRVIRCSYRRFRKSKFSRKVVE